MRSFVSPPGPFRSRQFLVSGPGFSQDCPLRSTCFLCHPRQCTCGPPFRTYLRSWVRVRSGEEEHPVLLNSDKSRASRLMLLAMRCWIFSGHKASGIGRLLAPTLEPLFPRALVQVVVIEPSPLLPMQRTLHPARWLRNAEPWRNPAILC